MPRKYSVTAFLLERNGHQIAVILWLNNIVDLDKVTDLVDPKKNLDGCMKQAKVFFSLVLILFAAGCVTSDEDIISNFQYLDNETTKIQNDLTACKTEAWNAGHDRQGGLLTEGPRVHYIEKCLSEKKWQKR